jgi:hypothetical protein
MLLLVIFHPAHLANVRLNARAHLLLIHFHTLSTSLQKYKWNYCRDGKFETSNSWFIRQTSIL